MAKWPTDRELEEIYRKGSEQHNFDYDEQSWRQMEVLLEKDRKRRWFIWFFSGIFLVGLTAFIFWMSNGNVQNEKAISSVTNNAKPEQISIDERSKESSALQIRSQADKISERAINDEPSNLNTELESSRFQNGGNLNVVDQSAISSNTIRHVETKSFLGLNKEEESQTSSNVTDEAFFPNQQNVTSVQAPDRLKVQKRYHLGSLSALNKLDMQSLLVEDLDFALPEQVLFDDNSKIENVSRFGLLVFGGAESSQTPNGKFGSLDTHVGIGLQHFINPKLGFMVGVGHVRDQYKAKGDDYKATSEFWKANGLPKWTDANCKMIEMSYGVLYHFNGWDNKGFALNATLNSNFMLSEHYYYNYEDQSKNFMSEWSMANTKWFSSMSLSANYNFPLANNWSLMAGPYAKIPISGIGHGDVMLSSVGMRLYLTLGL